MSSNRLYEDYFRDMVDHAEKAMRFVHAVSFEDFQDDEEKIFAVVYALGVIGEAARHIPKSLRDKHSEVPWKDITGMRDKVIHDYLSVDLNVVWRSGLANRSRRPSAASRYGETDFGHSGRRNEKRIARHVLTFNCGSVVTAVVFCPLDNSPQINVDFPRFPAPLWSEFHQMHTIF